MSSSTHNSVFIDTGLFLGLLDKEDDQHAKAKSIWSKLEEKNTKLITTNFILDETFTLVRNRIGVKLLKSFRDSLQESFSVLSIERVTVEDEGNSWIWLLRDWPKLSYTDCTSFAVMKRLGLKRAATFDKHFTLAGFQVEKPF